jgi:hypothetical protein
MLKALNDLGTVAMLAAGRLGAQVENTPRVDVRLELREDPAALVFSEAW